ncbi:hypothetical protein ACHAW6_000811, partial [Cyclotella cf. meneghiniana]
FLPAILGIDVHIANEFRILLSIGIKNGGLALRDPTHMAASLYAPSIEVTEMLAGTLTHNEPILIEAHQALSEPQARHSGRPDAMSKLPSTPPSWSDRHKSKK